MPTDHTVIDIFAGPGGLGEGFSNLQVERGHHPFQIGLSAEMEESAHMTLSLRSLYRKCMAADRKSRASYWRLIGSLTSTDPESLRNAVVLAGLGTIWHEVNKEVLKITLGTRQGNDLLRQRILDVTKRRNKALVLIGGPPCQAYSLIGRARNRGIQHYKAEKDSRHFLYEQYLTILDEFRPDVFIMENVKGILSSSVGGTPIFETILDDLRNPSGNRQNQYEILPLVLRSDHNRRGPGNFISSDYVVRAEEFGIPQSRHRVILLGVNRDSLASRIPHIRHLSPILPATCLGEVLVDLPRLRSGLSKSTDTGIGWQQVMSAQQARLVGILRRKDLELSRYVARQRFDSKLPRASERYRTSRIDGQRLREHFRGAGLGRLLNHDTRGHMPQDLCRYLFCSSYAALYGRSPISQSFPHELRPNHRSWGSGQFADRFRVQPKHLPASTITSHLAKDGHYFIHWDAQQCRSLTVREAARIQTFPDDYCFLGNRTQQYIQVGNAVPPILAQHIAHVVAMLVA